MNAFQLRISIQVEHFQLGETQVGWQPFDLVHKQVQFCQHAEGIDALQHVGVVNNILAKFQDFQHQQSAEAFNLLDLIETQIESPEIYQRRESFNRSQFVFHQGEVEQVSVMLQMLQLRDLVEVEVEHLQ